MGRGLTLTTNPHPNPNPNPNPNQVTAWAKVYGEEEGAFEFTLAGHG